MTIDAFLTIEREGSGMNPKVAIVFSSIALLCVCSSLQSACHSFAIPFLIAADALRFFPEVEALAAPPPKFVGVLAGHLFFVREAPPFCWAPPKFFEFLAPDFEVCWADCLFVDSASSAALSN